MALTIAVILVGVLSGCKDVSSQPAGAAAPSGPGTSAAFPLKVEPGKRYLEDAEGDPFLIHGDTAWSLIAQLTREEVDQYLDDRRARGFNTLLVSLIEHRFAENPPANAYGQLPFLTADDFSTPNEQYFAHADWVLRRAGQKGFLVLLVPSYVGAGGGDEGWYQHMLANGPAKLRQYGEFLGERYRDFSNILWVHGGDDSPPDRTLLKAIVEGIREFDTRSLHSAHGSRDTAVVDYWQGEPWLQVNTVYTYGPVYSVALEQYARPDRMPFFLIESVYENEHGATEKRLRTQAYHALLSGAAGQVFGNNPIWHFDGPGLFSAPVTWQQALESRGAQSMTHLRKLFAGVPWWQLEPDVSNTFLTDGMGSGHDRAVAARAADRSFAILYTPSARSITVDLEQLAGPQVTARWYDPAEGQFHGISGSSFPAVGSRDFVPPAGGNGAGFDDWVLILEAHS